MAISELQNIRNELARIRSGGASQSPTAEAQTDLKNSEKNTGNGVGYTLGKLWGGIVRSHEGWFDAAIAQVADVFGNDELAERVMKNDWMDYGKYDASFNPGKGWEFAGDVASGVGNMLPAIALSFVPFAGAGLSQGWFMQSASGQAVSDAVKETGELTDKEWAYGTASGLLEGAIEKISGGIGGTSVAKGVGKKLGKNALGKLAVNAVGEGGEEVASDILDPFLRKITGMSDTYEAPTLGELGRTFAVGSTTGAVMGGASRGIQAAKAGGFNNLNAAEDMQELTERQADNNLRQTEGKKATYTEQDIATTKENLSKRLQKMDGTTRAEFLKRNARVAQMFNEDGTVKDFAPSAEVYNTSAYSASLQGREGTFAYKPVADTSAISQEAKQVMNTLTKITSGNTNIVLTEDALTTENGKSANGLYQDGVIYLNAKATDYDKALRVGVHEVVHGLEGTKEYNELAKYISQQIKNEPDLAQRYNIDTYRNAYDKLLKGEWTESTKDYQAATEIFADYIGNVVAENKTLLNNLVARNSNVFVRFLNWVRNSIAKLGESAEERKMRKDLQKLEKMLVEALQAGNGGITLEEVEDLARTAEKARKTQDSNVQSVKFGETVDNKSTVGYNKAQARASLVAKYINVPQYVRNSLYSQLNQLYNGISDGIADGIALSYGNDIYIVDSGKDKGKLDFGVRKKVRISNTTKRAKYVNKINQEVVNDGRAERRILKKLGVDLGDNSRGNVGRLLREDVPNSQGESKNQQNRVSQEVGDRGVQVLTESTSRKSIDVEYANAIKNGDTAFAQKMVDKAAKEAGYDKKRFHETKEENIIHVFNLDLNTNASADYGTPFGVFTKSHNRSVGLGGKQMSLYVKADRTFRVKDRTEIAKKLPQEYSALVDEINAIDNEYDTKYEKLSDDLLDSFAVWLDKNDPTDEMREAWDVQRPLEEQFGDVLPQDIIEKERKFLKVSDEWTNKTNQAILGAKKWLTKWLRDNGYDSMELEFDNGAGNRVTDALIVLDKEQVKSAEPATYDDNGNLIPLSKRFNKKSADIRYSLPVDVETDVKKHYGSTYNWKETGYILQDGTRLDLSGRNEGARGGYRQVDHRDIFAIFEEGDYSYGTEALVEFMGRGNIRVIPETPGINLQVEPNAEQYRLIQDFVERVGWKEGYFSVDIDNKNGDTIETLTYEGKPSGRKVVADLKQYFKTGEKPYQSKLSAFRYSIDVNSVEDIESKYEPYTKYLNINEGKDYIRISNINVKEEYRNQGIGQKILDDVISYADSKGKTITLTPTKEFGTYARLKKWYAKNGFVYNAGKNADLRISDTMYRLPEKKTSSRASIDVDADLADFPNIDKWFESLTAEELRELIDNDYSVKDISEELNVEPQKLRYLIKREGLGNSYVEDSKKAVMKQTRIDEAIEDSGASNPTYARDYITAISPKDFIDLTVMQNHVERDTFDTEVIGDHGSKMGEWDYEKALQTSRSPYLQIDKATGRVIGHNGRHRIRALEKAGIQSVEIQVEFFDEDGRLIKYDAETIPKMAISSQFDTDIETTISKVIPLNESHRAEIESTYGEKVTPKAGVRYALDAELDKKTTERVQTVVSDEKLTLKERWENTVEKLNEGKADQWIKAQIAWTDEQAGIIAAGRNLGIVVHGEVQRARVAKASAINMLNDSQRDYSGKKRVGDSLKAIFKPIQSRGKKVAQDFNLYLLHQLNVDRMSVEERGLGENKPVFEKDVDKAFSLEKIQQLEKQYPEFKATAEKVWKYNQNLLQYRVDAGLITQAQADQMTKMYPHYVPAFYEHNGGGTSGAFVGQKGVAVKTGIKSAKGSTGVSNIEDVQTSIARQTVAVIRAASINKIVEKLYDGAMKTKNFVDFEIVGKESMTDPDVNYDTDIPKENQVFFYKDGERITLDVSQYIYAGFRGLTAGAQLGDPITTLSAKGINLFKKLVTSWNPLFAVTNAVRDAQEALFYTKYGKRFFANYGKALVTRKSDPRLKELWEQYKAMGGTGSGYFSRDTGVFDDRSKLRKGVEWIGDKMQIVNEWVEQAPRFAEFVASVEAGNSLEQALYDSAEVTTNFSRGGKMAKALNRHLIPFLNPSIQGWSKMWRGWVAPMDGKSAAEIERLSKQSKGRRFLSNYGALMFKAILCGVSVGLFNDMLYRWIDDDEDYANLPLNIKENYYLIKVGKKFIKIPKGRVVALYGSAWTRLSEAMNGNEDALNAWDWAKSASEMVSPLESAFRSIIAPVRDVQTNTTWYGGQIENASMENLAPSERYDEGTSKIAIAMGKALNYSPKKIHYLLDQYSGVLGDFILPKTTNKAEKGMLSSRFVVDPLYNSDVSTKYYDYKEELTFAKNSGDTNAKLMLKYMNEVQDDLSKMYQQKRDIANDNSLTNKEKREQTEIIQGLINATLSSSVDMADEFEQALIDNQYEQAVAVLTSSKAYTKLDEKSQTYASNKMNEYYYEMCKAEVSGTKPSMKYALYTSMNAPDLVVYLSNINNIEADKDKKGNTISGSRKEKVHKYIQGLRLSAQQKNILMYLAGYKPTDAGQKTVEAYLTKQGYTAKEVDELWI